MQRKFLSKQILSISTLTTIQPTSDNDELHSVSHSLTDARFDF